MDDECVRALVELAIPSSRIIHRMFYEGHPLTTLLPTLFSRGFEGGVRFAMLDPDIGSKWELDVAGLTHAHHDLCRNVLNDRLQPLLEAVRALPEGG